MLNLKDLYEEKIEKIDYIERKKRIVSPKTILFGSINSGKSYLLLDYLSKFQKESVLYVDWSDLRVKKDELFAKLDEILLKNKEIKAIGIDNFNDLNLEELVKFVEKKNSYSIIISTRQKELVIDGFERLAIYPLDFEEFMLFDKKRSDTQAILAAFLRHGNGAKNPFIQVAKIAEFEQLVFRANLTYNELLVLQNSLQYVDEIFSVNRVYLELKESNKISKDSVYGAIAKFENELLLNLIANYEDKRAMKKLYFSHFGLRDSFDFKKDFHKKFANALFCELLNLDEEICYTKELDFYLPKRGLAILLAPFSANEFVFLKFKKLTPKLKELKISKLNVISMANSDILDYEGLRCEIVPFYQFVLGL